MKPILDWIKNSWIGKQITDLWRMFFNDDTGVSMRKTLAFNCFFVLDYIVIKYTDKENLHYVIGELIVAGLTLLGIVTYSNMKNVKAPSDESK